MDYEVQKGDTIFSICKKLYGDYSKRNLILEYNNITSPNDIRVGQILIVPKP
nr:LysM peptidoglycan-binding domain-containing protein [Anaerosolibacter carboniphilus]